MGRRRLAGLKAYQTQIDRGRAMDEAVTRIIEQAKRATNEWDTSNWRITVTPLRPKGEPVEMSFSEAASILVLWTTPGPLSWAFAIWDAGQNFGFSNTLAEMFEQGAEIHTPKAIFRRKEEKTR